jgi:hypothetical protein
MPQQTLHTQLTLVINITVIRVRRADLAGAEQPALAVALEPE